MPNGARSPRTYIFKEKKNWKKNIFLKNLIYSRLVRDAATGMVFLIYVYCYSHCFPMALALRDSSLNYWDYGKRWKPFSALEVCSVGNGNCNSYLSEMTTVSGRDGIVVWVRCRPAFVQALLLNVNGHLFNKLCVFKIKRKNPFEHLTYYRLVRDTVAGMVFLIYGYWYSHRFSCSSFSTIRL